ncbi:MAG TPA: hypothetical protein VM686_22730, partial [Polyangiaceae bacterium]|nr:hypothetical protein [Polyangiaceae bacterium]
MAQKPGRKNGGSRPATVDPREGRHAGTAASHAREIPTGLSVEDRVAYIADLMERLEWVRGKTGK